MVTVRVWDLPLRLFHWALVACVMFSAGTGLLGEKLGAKVAEWHALSGYSILALLLFRLVWGFVGGSQARFASFVRGPRAVLAYVRAARAGAPVRTLGHNPAGGWSVLAMLFFLTLQSCLGLFLADEDLGFEAPLAKYISAGAVDLLKEAHEANFALLVALVALHLAAIAYYLFVKRDNLVRPMFTGDKAFVEAPGAAPALPPTSGSAGFGLVVFLAAAAAVWALVRFA